MITKTLIKKHSFEYSLTIEINESDDVRFLLQNAYKAGMNKALNITSVSNNENDSEVAVCMRCKKKLPVPLFYHYCNDCEPNLNIMQTDC